MLEEPASARAEAFRMLRANLDFLTLDRDVRTIMVTSALQQEGKSTTVANLAVAFARAGKRVVLVDLDLRRPVLARFFDLEGPGLTQVALGDVPLEEALTQIVITDPPAPRRRLALRRGGNGNGNLTRELLGLLEVLPSGPVPPDPGEFVSSPALGKILRSPARARRCRPRRRAGALHVGDVIALSSRVDGIVVVARSKISRRQTLTELNRLLALVRTPVLGFVVTGEGDGESYAAGFASDGYRSGAFDAVGGSDPSGARLNAVLREALWGMRPMSVTDHTHLLQSLQLHEELQTTVDERTLQILDRRRRTAVVKRRGWLVRRMLLTADVVGLVSAFLVAEWLAPAVDTVDTYSPRLEILAFLATVPAWVVITKLYGLYDRDDERANHSTADDFGGVLHGHGLHMARHRRYVSDRVAHPSAQKLVVFWAVAIAFICRCPGRGKGPGAAERGLHPEHGHRRCGRRRPAVREEVLEPPGVRDEPRRLRRRQAEGAPK